MPSANLIQSAKRWLDTAITTGMSALERPLDQIGQAFALTLLPSEPVDDHEIGALLDGTGDRAPASSNWPTSSRQPVEQVPRFWNSGNSSPLWTSMADRLGASTQ